MKRIFMGIMAAVIFAAPCVYDVFSEEPSPLVGLVAAVTVADQYHW
ncbi:hypothetical protein SB748_25175 [Rhizobium sp. SIMBA_035]